MEEDKHLEPKELLESMSEKLGFTPHILEIIGELDSESLKNTTGVIINYCQTEPCLQR